MLCAAVACSVTSSQQVKQVGFNSPKFPPGKETTRVVPTKRDLSQGNTMYVVPYAHLDTQWRWAYPQVIREFIANTLHQNFALIDRYPHYVFNFSGSRRYEMMKEYYPADYAKLKDYIKAGRWFPCGSSVDENDANVPSGESLIRHVLYGNRFFRREFGTASQEFMLPDCFGFPYALPSILAHCGILGFSTQKLTWGSAVGIPFKVGTWEGPDGRSIVAALDPGSYGASVEEDLSQNTSWLARIQNTGKQSGAYVDYHYYGTGDQGGAPRQDSVDWVEKSIAGKGPISVVSSHSDEMFTNLTPGQIAKLPHYKGELLLTEHSAGSISSQGYMKRWNRKNELLADAAERASVAAMWLGGASYPSQRIYNAWDLVLGSQMHDMLPGTSIPKAYEFCWNDELLAQNQLAAITQDAVGAVTSVMDTRSSGRALVVYNPLSIDREDVVEATVAGFDTSADLQVVGPDGSSRPAQILSRDGDQARILFVAKVPATGFASFDVKPATKKARSGSQLNASDTSIENERFRVEVNSAGDIASVFDKANHREVLKAPARLDFQYENPRQFPAWNMDWEDAKRPPRAYVGGPAKIRILESGPIRVAIEVEREADGSRFVQQIRLSAGGAGDRVEIANKIDWQTRETALKASFPLTTGNPEATYDLQLGAIRRANNNEKKYEVPQHQWLDLTKPDGSYGVAILNDCKFGSDKPTDDLVRLTLIYTPGVRGGFADQATQDFGKHDILYALAPHTGTWQQAEVPWMAKRLNQPLRAFEVPPHAGKLGKTFSLLTSSSKQVEVQALKKAEDSNEVIVRLRELDGNPAENVRIRSTAKIVSAREVTGQELPIAGAVVRDGQLLTSVPAFGLKAFALKLAGPPAKAALPVSQALPLAYDADVASTDENPADGAFDREGRSIAAEEFPARLKVGTVEFKLGPTGDGKMNALLARGQEIPLPSGYSRVYVLAAATEDAQASFKIGTKERPTTVQAWSGYIGQWDNRLWNTDPGPNFTNYGEMSGLEPGFVKDGEVAWFCSHRHAPTGNTYYEYTYLYKYGFDIPRGAGALTLPNDPRIKVFAVSVTKNENDSARAAQPLYDRMADHTRGGTPSISPSVGTFADATTVTITPPLYWRSGGVHYTVDGTDPTASSAAYAGPIDLNDASTIRAAEVDADGKVGPIKSVSLSIRDTTAPSIVSVSSPKTLGFVRVQFSERVDRESAEKFDNYRFSSGATVATATLSPNLRSVEMTLDRPLVAGQVETLTVTGIKDLSVAGNTIPPSKMEVAERGAVFTSPALEPKTAKAFNVQGLPVKAHDSWTLNLFCKIDSQPEDRTIIAGFGRSVDGRTGTGRYFTKFARGINFWVANEDVATDVPLDLGKWQMLTATYDGKTMRLYKNGERIAEQQVELANDQSQVRVMPLDAWERQRKFLGEVRDLTIWDQDLSSAAVKRLWEAGQKG